MVFSYTNIHAMDSQATSRRQGPESNAVRIGEAKYQFACSENFILELSRYGRTRRDIVSKLNFFMNVPIDPLGKYPATIGGPGSNHNCETLYCKIKRLGACGSLRNQQKYQLP